MGYRDHWRIVGVLVMLCVLAVFVVSCTNAGLARSKQQAVPRRTTKTLHSGKYAPASLLPLVWRAIPPPSRALGGYLAGVSCVSQKFCVVTGTTTPANASGVNAGGAILPWDLYPCENCRATGDYEGRRPRYPGNALLEIFDGRSWHDQGIRGQIAHSGLSAVSCVSQKFCVAVGSGPSGPLIVTYSGRAWKEVAFNKNASASERGVVLNAVSCVSQRFCVAVGFKKIPDVGTDPAWGNWIGDQAVVDVLHGKTWHLESAPNMSSQKIDYDTSLFGSYPAASDQSQLLGVSCVTAKFCIATGAGGWLADYLLVDTYNGKTWSVGLPQQRWFSSSTAPQVVSYPYLIIGRGAAQLAGVSCTSPEFCAATGIWENPAQGGGPACPCVYGPAFPFVETFNGNSWSVAASPNLAGGALDAVSCISQTFCVAVSGSSVNPSPWEEFWHVTYGPNPLPPQTFDGTTWQFSQLQTRVPTGLFAISCTPTKSSAYCMAVGAQYVQPQTVANSKVAVEIASPARAPS